MTIMTDIYLEIGTMTAHCAAVSDVLSIRVWDYTKPESKWAVVLTMPLDSAYDVARDAWRIDTLMDNVRPLVTALENLVGMDDIPL